MTRDDLDRTLDDLNQKAEAAGDDGGRPGLITVPSDVWVGGGLAHALRPTCVSLHDGLRYRDIQIHVGAAQTMAVLSRADAGDRGAPYRDLAPVDAADAAVA